MGWPGSGKAIVGYDLGNEFVQISYSLSDSGEVETFSQVAGEESYNIPAALARKSGVNRWFYGKEALRCKEEEQGILIDHLLALALAGEPVSADGESRDPVALLTLFVRRSLGMLAQTLPFERIGALMITCETLDARTLEVLGQVAAGLGLKTDRIAFQSREESYYHYMRSQPEELRLSSSALFTRKRDSIRIYRMECNRRTSPAAVFVEECERRFPRWDPGRESSLREADAALLEAARELCEGRAIGSIFLIGDGFEQDWMKESLRYLCRNRRVFQGSNLFSKGAVFGMRARLEGDAGGRESVFLGRDTLKSNIGLEVLRQGEASYYALLDAGENWYEAQAQLEFYLSGGAEIDLTITPLTGGNGRQARIVLEDAPEGITRFLGKFSMEAENILAVEIADEGFGEIRPSTGRVWRETIEFTQKK